LYGNASFFIKHQGTNLFTAQADRKGDEIAQVASDYPPAELANFEVLAHLYRRPLSTPLSCGW
jgi:hypothetical protein